MAGTVMPAPKFIGLDNNANPVSGGKLYTYVAGTTTPQATYSDVDLTIANTNPVVLDSAGRATVFLSGASYKFVLTDANDAAIWTQDNVQAVAPFSTNLDVLGTAGEAILAGQACYLSDGSGGKTAGKWYLADADNAYSSSLPQIAMAPDAVAQDASGTFRLQGAATKANTQAAFVVGSTYYLAGGASKGLLSLTPGTNQRIMGQADSTTTLVISPNPPNVAVTPTFVNSVTVTSTDGGATAGPVLDLYRDSASPAASDQIGEMRFSGEDSAGNKQLYARIYGQIADATSTTEDGQVRVSVVSNGTETLMLVLTESGAVLPDLTTQDLGSGAKPWRDVFLSGTGKLDFGNGDVTVTASANTLTFAGASSGYAFQTGLVSSAEGIAIAATKRFYLDGVAGTGDTYIHEASANSFEVVVGGSVAIRASYTVGVQIFPTSGGVPLLDSTGYAMTTWPTTASAANAHVANGNYIRLSTSSSRWKHDIVTLDGADALAAVMAMRPITYRGKTDKDQRRFVGFIAEEMQEIAPLLCTYDDGGESGTPNYVTYDRVTAYLVSVVQQQQTEINALKARIH